MNLRNRFQIVTFLCLATFFVGTVWNFFFGDNGASLKENIRVYSPFFTIGKSNNCMPRMNTNVSSPLKVCIVGISSRAYISAAFGE